MREKKKFDLTIIFDGGPFFSSSRERLGSLAIVYAGSHHKADPLIKTYLEQAPSETVLISSDRELVTYARRYAIMSLAPSIFSEFFKDTNKQQEISHKKTTSSAVKLSATSSEELDKLMIDSTATVLLKKEERSMKPVIPKEKSEKDRALQELIKRLSL